MGADGQEAIALFVFLFVFFFAFLFGTPVQSPDGPAGEEGAAGVRTRGERKSRRSFVFVSVFVFVSATGIAVFRFCRLCPRRRWRDPFEEAQLPRREVLLAREQERRRNRRVARRVEGRVAVGSFLDGGERERIKG